MAVPVALAKQDLASKLVQEIAKKGDIPESYFHKNGFPQAIDSPDLWRDTLLIDFSLLSSSSTSELAKLRSALSQWGCFQVINHGIEISFLEELFEISKQFFALPLEEKLKCSASDDIVQGYGSDEVSTGSHTTLNWNDRLFLYLFPKEKFKLQCWPEKPEKFRGMIDEYSKKLATVNEVLCKAMEKSLNLEENCLNFGNQGPTIARLTFYPRCPYTQHILGSKPHSDATTLTYLLPEKEVEGLQILKDKQWYNVLVIPGTIFINLGDLGEVETNGMFKSAVHRVVTNSVKDRISVAMFFMPDQNEEICPQNELVSDHHPQVYKRIKMSEYMNLFCESFRRGSRALDTLRI